MGITIEALVDNPLIRTRFVAGRLGAARPVVWAHTCEVSDPWNWMSSGDLLMTDGYGFPKDPRDQVDFIRNLDDAGLSGLALAEGFAAPPVTDEAIRAADELGFPVLETARSVPFVTIARMVADNNRGPATARAARVLRLYDILRRSHRATDARPGLLEQLGKELRAALHVVDVVRGRELMPSSEPLPEHIREASMEKFRESRGRLAAFNRMRIDQETVLLLPVGERDAHALVLRLTSPGDDVDLVLAEHVAMIAELDVERREARATRLHVRGATLIRSLLDSSIVPEAAAAELKALGLGPGPWRVTAWQAASVDSRRRPDLAEELRHAPWPNVQLEIDDVHLMVVTGRDFEDGLDVDIKGIDAAMGASELMKSPARLTDAFRQARWALESALTDGAGTAVYGSHGSCFLPPTVAEGEWAVHRLLGPVLEYDAEHDARLIESLQVYFEVNRSWQEGANRLGIHKQTLVYRMKKVEELTGTDLRDFGAQAELYLALKTWRLLQLK